jgi:ParB/RepB/Spo0J family partition protein
MAKKKFDYAAWQNETSGNYDNIGEGVRMTPEEAREDTERKLGIGKIPTYNEALPIDQLYDYIDKEGNGQPFRVNPNDVKTLAESIKEVGVLEAITVTKISGRDGYMIISGHTRTAAAKKIGLTTIPAVIRTYDSDEDAEKAMLDANIRRKKLYPTDLCAIYKRWLAIRLEFGMTVEQVADKFGISVTTMRAYVEIENCLQEIREAIDEDRIDIGVIHSIAVLSKKDQQAFIDDCLSQEEHITKKEMTEFVSTLSKEKKPTASAASDAVAPFKEKDKPADEEAPDLTEEEAPAATAASSATKEYVPPVPGSEELPIHRDEEEFDAFSAAVARMANVKALTIFAVTYYYGDNEEEQSGYFLSMSLRNEAEVSDKLTDIYGYEFTVASVRKIGTMEVNEAIEDGLVSAVAVQ